jgi:hypothetical protein
MEYSELEYSKLYETSFEWNSHSALKQVAVAVEKPMN